MTSDEQKLRATVERQAREIARWNELHRVIAEELNCDPETWPDHRNAPLAIGATFVLIKQRAERAEAMLDAFKRELEITCAHLGLDHLLAERDALRECVNKADVMRQGEDCPMCDSGKLRNPEKEHWGTCAFAKYDAARAKVKP